ncbi:integration host factor subunit alpha [Candidatus Pelagibacter sp.]|nr:integration host factor subunit alpha [Candidatus Pelagibacter sp.]
MRINLTKKEVVNSIYMQIGYSKRISENLLDDFFDIIFNSLKKNNKVKIAKFGTFHVRLKKSRVGRNPKTKENKIISERKVILFKPSKELKKIINESNEAKT